MANSPLVNFNQGYCRVQQSQPQKRHIRNLGQKTVWIAGLTGLALLNIAEPAAAHHLMDGRIPANWLEGFLSGLAHPVIGLDHLAFVISIGILSAGRRHGVLLPAFFLVAALGGTGLHLLQVDLPETEVAIALSVIALGLILSLGKQLNFKVLVGLAAIAGLFHGYAYGEAIVGAQMSPLIAYLTGFTLIQYLIAMLTFWVASVRMQKTAEQTVRLRRYFGYAVCSIGVVFLSVALNS